MKLSTKYVLAGYHRGECFAIFSLSSDYFLIDWYWIKGVNKIDKRRLRAHVTAKLFRENVIGKGLGDEYLKRDKITIDDILSGKIKIEFSGAPS